jgi:hypothetical protein
MRVAPHAGFKARRGGMSGNEDTGERFMRFHALYGDVIKSEFDALEFAEDDLYAFQVLDRAFRSDNQDLRNLAAHLQTQREAALETITLRAGEILENTRRMKTLELKVLEAKGESGDINSAYDAESATAVGDASDAERLGTDAPGQQSRRKSWWR